MTGLTKCPRCFSLLHDGQRAFTVARSAGGPRYPDPVASAFCGTYTDSGPIFDVCRPPGHRGALPGPAEATHALGGPVTEICPVCHMDLPDGWRLGQAICIAMAGARATGKSLYIAVLVKQLQLLCEQLGVAMEPVTRASAQAYMLNYETPLYEQRGLIPPTPTAHTLAPHQREPLMFSLGVWHGVRRFLVLRDVAGEDLENGDPRAAHFAFFAGSDAVLFMFDPLRVKGIRDQLADLLPAQSHSGADPRSVLTNVLAAIGAGTPRLAVICSKFDALLALREVQGSEWSQLMSHAGAAYARDSGPSWAYDKDDGQLLHEEMRSLLQRLHGGSIVAAVENPSSGRALEHRYFAVSALGHPPSGSRVHARGIAPFRCTDPLRWVTSGFGVL